MLSDATILLRTQLGRDAPCSGAGVRSHLEVPKPDHPPPRVAFQPFRDRLARLGQALARSASRAARRLVGAIPSRSEAERGRLHGGCPLRSESRDVGCRGQPARSRESLPLGELPSRDRTDDGSCRVSSKSPRSPRPPGSRLLRFAQTARKAANEGRVPAASSSGSRHLRSVTQLRRRPDEREMRRRETTRGGPNDRRASRVGHVRVARTAARILGADQPLVIGVDDSPAGCPELDLSGRFLTLPMLAE